MGTLASLCQCHWFRHIDRREAKAPVGETQAPRVGRAHEEEGQLPGVVHACRTGVIP